jgi:hypothetical protein
MANYDTAWFNKETEEVHTPKCRMVYPNLITPRGMKGEDDSKPKFSVSLLIPKTANIDALKTLAADTAQAKFGQGWQTKKLRNPFLKTVDYETLSELAEQFPSFIRVSANVEFPPFIFNPDTSRFRGDASDIYGGRWAVGAVRAYGYDAKGNKGVAFGLQRIQLLDHDEPIAGGRIETASGFEAVSGVSSNTAAPATADDVWG